MIKLVTVSDDRSGRKGGMYEATQYKIQALLGDWIDQAHYNIRDIPSFSPLLENTDAAKNGRVYKPWVILQELNKLQDGDYLIYNDCSPELWEGVQPLDHYNPDLILTRLCDQANGILVGFVKWDSKVIPRGSVGRHTHHFFTLDNLIELFADGKYRDSFQCASGMICIRKDTFTISLVEQWLHLNSIERFSTMNVDETEDSFHSGKPGHKMGNRHDQSILSLLLNAADWYYCDIVYNELNPYNFLNFCIPNHNYTFINSNTGKIV